MTRVAAGRARSRTASPGQVRQRCSTSDVEVRTSATAPAVPGVPTNVRCDGLGAAVLARCSGCRSGSWCRRVAVRGRWCPSQLTATVTLLAPGLAVSVLDGTESEAVAAVRAAQRPRRACAAAPFTVTVKLAGTLRFRRSSRSPQLTQTFAPKRQSVAATGSVPKYPSVVAAAARQVDVADPDLVVRLAVVPDADLREPREAVGVLASRAAARSVWRRGRSRCGSRCAPRPRREGSPARSRRTLGSVRRRTGCGSPTVGIAAARRGPRACRRPAPRSRPGWRRAVAARSRVASSVR